MYVLFGHSLSLFTRKLEAAMMFYGEPFEFRVKSPENAAEIERRAGTHQMPVLLTPENWMIADTTPIIDMLDGRYPFRRMVPEGPLGVLVHLIEDHLDEWVSRVMVHYRWHYDESAALAAPMLAGPDAEAQRTFAAWGVRACRATGTETAAQQQAAEREYERLLQAMDDQLGRTRYLLGDRPTSVDCAALGGLRAHTWHDPVPRRVVAGYPRIVNWVESARQWDGEGALAPFPDSTDFARHVLGEMPAAWGRFAQGNRDALERGEKAFRIEAYGHEVSFLTRPYPERARQMVAERIARRLTATDRDAVWSWLRRVGLEDVLRLAPAEAPAAKQRVF